MSPHHNATNADRSRTELVNRADRLERELEEARSNAAQAESEVAALRTSLEEARANGWAKADKEAGYLTAEIERLGRELEEAERLVKMYRAEDVKGQLGTLSEAYGELEAELKAAEAQSEEARQERDKARKRAAEIGNREYENKARIGDLEAALRDAAEFLEGAHVHHGSESVKLALVRGHLRSALQPTPTQESESHQ